MAEVYRASSKYAEVSSADGLFWMVVIIHALDAWMGRLSQGGVTIPGGTGFFLMAYLIVAMVAAFGVFKNESPEHQYRRFGKYLGVSTGAYFLPLIVNWLLSGTSSAILVGVLTPILYFAPMWILYLWVFEREHLGGATRKTFAVYQFLWILALFIAVLPAIQNAAQAVEGPGAGGTQISIQTSFVNLATATKSNIQNLLNSTKTKTKQQINYATGDAFTSKVDKNAKEKLGVTIDSLQVTQPLFTANDPVGVYTRLNVQTIDEPLKIKINCSAQGVADSAIKSFSPKDERIVFAEEVLDIDCEFLPGVFKETSATISINADFTMKTFAYLKTYFMERARLAELRTAKIDPFQQYGITDRNPVTTYTSGPVSIAMSFNQPPIGIDTEIDEFTGTLGVSLTNTWPGQLQKIDQLYLLMPRGFEVTEISGITSIFTKAKCIDIAPLSDWCDDSVANLFIVTPSANPVATQQSVIVRARIRASRADYETLLGTTPLVTKYFKAAADYTYRLSSQRTVQIQKSTSGGTISSEKAFVKGTPMITPSATDANIKYELTASSAAEIRLCQGSTKDCKDYKLFYDPTSSTIHEQNITGLQPNTLYTIEIAGISSACSTTNNRCTDGTTTFNFITAAS